jgi:hypothetical protein
MLISRNKTASLKFNLSKSDFLVLDIKVFLNLSHNYYYKKNFSKNIKFIYVEHYLDYISAINFI